MKSRQSISRKTAGFLLASKEQKPGTGSHQKEDLRRSADMPCQPAQQNRNDQNQQLTGCCFFQERRTERNHSRPVRNKKRGGHHQTPQKNPGCFQPYVQIVEHALQSTRVLLPGKQEGSTHDQKNQSHKLFLSALFECRKAYSAEHGQRRNQKGYNRCLLSFQIVQSAEIALE